MNEENELKKEYLKQYGKSIRQMERNLLRIKELRLNKMCPSIVLDGMPHTSNHADLSEYAVLLDEEERKYLKNRYKRIKLCKEITDKIEQMENEDEKDILIYRYIKMEKWESICMRMGHSWQHIHRIHSTALKNFVM